MKLGDIFNSQEAWVTLLKAPTNGKTAYLLSKYYRTNVEGVIKDVTEARNVCINKYGTQEGGQTIVQQDSLPQFIEELNVVLNEEVDVEKCNIKMDDLVDSIEKCSAVDLLVLEPFFN